MNDEMQTAEVEVDNNIENTEVEVESSPTPETELDKVRKGYEKRLGVITAKNRHNHDLLQQKDAEIETLKAVKEPAKELEIPELPDDDLRFDNPEEYKAQVKTYHNAVAQQARVEADKTAESKRVAERERETQSEQQAKHSELVDAYIGNGINSGISEVKMQANELVLQENKLPVGLANFIYSDESGAKIVDYLADNPAKLQELRNAPPGQGFVMIANEIKPQALSSNPAQTNAPDPLNPTRGGGSPPSDEHPLNEGATFT